MQFIEKFHRHFGFLPNFCCSLSSNSSYAFFLSLSSQFSTIVQDVGEKYIYHNTINKESQIVEIYKCYIIYIFLTVSLNKRLQRTNTSSPLMCILNIIINPLSLSSFFFFNFVQCATTLFISPISSFIFFATSSKRKIDLEKINWIIVNFFFFRKILSLFSFSFLILFFFSIYFHFSSSINLGLLSRVGTMDCGSVKINPD